MIDQMEIKVGLKTELTFLRNTTITANSAEQNRSQIQYTSEITPDFH